MQSNNQPGAANRMVILVRTVGSNDEEAKEVESRRGYDGIWREGGILERNETTKIL
jgi:hypothetical protein